MSNPDMPAIPPPEALRPAPEAPDPLEWLEQVDAPAALDWVGRQNARTAVFFESRPAFGPLRAALQSIYDAKERIPYVQKAGRFLYNFWRDAEHPRGVWRRTTLAEYRQPEPDWHTVLDLDVLAAAEGENWVWHGAQCRDPGADRALVGLSRGGADAAVVREFDLDDCRFVDGGFALPEAKSGLHWIDRDHVFVATDFGPGSLTASGYPRLVKEWRRGQPLAEARPVFAGEHADVAVSAFVAGRRSNRRQFVQRSTGFYTSEYFLRQETGLARIDVPDDVQLGLFGAQLLLRLRKDWTVGGATYPGGSLLAIDFEQFLRGGREFHPLFRPTPTSALEGYAATRSYLVLHILDDVQGRLVEWSLADGHWSARDGAAPALGSLGLSAYDEEESDAYFLTHVDFLTPDTLYLAWAGSGRRERLKQRPAYFDASGLETVQWRARSRDGTEIPYFVVGRAGLVLDGSQPTLLYGYGGFEVALTPAYSAGVGKAWLAQGGVYVVANLRGGGEFGPRWHAAALKERRQNAFDDFIAVAEDLLGRGVTRPQRLGIMGGSNGGLLMGAMITQRPELFGAVVCQVPLLDMRRYSRLLAGASWIAEYGDPDDPADWAYIGRYSPYHRLAPGVAYPSVLFTTSTRDDRVHPGHARKMMARMEHLGVRNAWYYENTEGGHAGASDNRQLAYRGALEFTFLWTMLDPARQAAPTAA